MTVIARCTEIGYPTEPIATVAATADISLFILRSRIKKDLFMSPPWHPVLGFDSPYNQLFDCRIREQEAHSMTLEWE